MIYILLCGAGFTFISYGVGSLLLRPLAKDINTRLDEFIYSAGLGLAVLGYSVYIIGSMGRLYPSNIAAMISIYALISVKPVWRLLSGLPWNKIPGYIIGLGIFEKFLLALVLLTPFICLFGVSAPATGNDALVYHLYHPKLFIQNHAIGHIPFTRESMWPYLTEMLFTLALMIQSAELANFFHWIFGALSIAAVFSFASRLFSKKHGLLAAALFCLSPGIFMQSTYAYIDLALCFYSLTALFTFISWQKQKNNLLLILSGVFTGLAMSVKILGGFTLITLCIILIIMAVRREISFRSLIGSIFIFIAVSSIVSAAWYMRSYIVLGNPVYPFLSGIFKSGWSTNIGARVGTSRDIIGFFRLPWDLVVHFDNFGGEQIGVIFLAFFPFLFFIPLKTNKDIQYMALFGLINAIIWFIVGPHIRFLFVDIAIVYTLIAIGFINACKTLKLSFLKILLCLLLSFNVSLCLYYNMDAVKLRFGIINHKDYLFKKERTYPLAEFVNQNLPPNALVVILDEQRLYYFDREHIHGRRFGLMSKEPLYQYVNRRHVEEQRPVYLVLTEGTDIPDSFKERLFGKAPVWSMKREINEGVFGTYYVYRIF